MRSFLIAGILLASSLALGQQRYDHRGSLGLTIAAGGEALTAVSSKATGAESGFRIPLEIGGTFSLTDHTELRLAGRLAPGLTPISTLAGSVYAGARNSFSFEQLKTFFDLELAVHVAPYFAIGARAAFGVQYDFLPIMGVYAQLGGQLGGATSLRLSGEVMVGVQFRTYLFE